VAINLNIEAAANRTYNTNPAEEFL